MPAALTIDVLGPLSVVDAHGAVRPLPQSKKTRGLLAYLALSGRAHRRDRLCNLFWDVADDPRGALRWSLSKLRGVINDDGHTRLVADRKTVEFVLDGAAVDLLSVRAEVRKGLDGRSVEELEGLARSFRGELLEGLELADFHEFTAWCEAEREQARRLHREILDGLVHRLADEPERALAPARERCRIEPLDEEARAHLVTLLASTGRRSEALAQFRSGRRLLEELGVGPRAAMLTSFDALSKDAATNDVARAPSGAKPAAVPDRASPPARESVQQRAARVAGDADAQSPSKEDLLVGRDAERRRLLSLLDEVADASGVRVLSLLGEAGVGKTRLLDELRGEARRRGGLTLFGAAFEAEMGRPYGPIVDALRTLPAGSLSDDVRNALAPLLPELGVEVEAEYSRDRLFGGVVDLVTGRAHGDAPAVLVFDDVHWSDEATAELLHYLVRMCRHRPVLVVLAARDGELVDNEAMMRLSRGLRRDGCLEELTLCPLDGKSTAELARHFATDEAIDVDEVFAMSGGNPLLARELARFGGQEGGGVAGTLADLIGDRLERLSDEAGDVLRWGAILGPSFEVAHLEALSSLGFEALVDALERLERHALIGGEGSSGAYAFPHDLVRQVVYGEISGPRRRLMHLQVARMLAGRDDPDGSIAVELAHHAGLGGEVGMAAEACARAGRQCLRVFANAEAYAHARRGLRYAEKLGGRARVEREVELTHIQHLARRPADIEAAAAELEALGERALGEGASAHARAAFQLVSNLRWEEGAVRDATRMIFRAEQVTHGATDAVRVDGIADAARCLVILEQDIGQAEAMLLEARAVAARAGTESFAIADGLGLLRLHGGDLEAARQSFSEARDLARLRGERLLEFYALEHLVMAELFRQEAATAARHATELVELGERLRGGSEHPFAQALLALCRYELGDEEASAALDEALPALRAADAKQRLAFLLGRAAELDLARGADTDAETRAEETLELAGALQRPTEMALSRCILHELAQKSGRGADAAKHEAALSDLRGYARRVRGDVERVLGHPEPPGAESADIAPGVEDR